MLYLSDINGDKLLLNDTSLVDCAKRWVTTDILDTEYANRVVYGYSNGCVTQFFNSHMDVIVQFQMRNRLMNMPEIKLDIQRNFIGALDIIATSVTGVSGLTSYRFPDFISHIGSQDNPLSKSGLGRCVFDDASQLKTVILPSELQFLGDDVFANCSSLTTVKLPEALKAIGIGAFKNCTSLRDINIPSSIHSIGSLAFASCKSIEHLDLPASLEFIDSHAFTGCDVLTSVSLPDSLYTVSNSLFEFCSNLKSIRLPCFPIEAKNRAQATSTIKAHGYKSSLNKGVFRACTSLEDVEVPVGYDYIMQDAFYGCANLKRVRIHGKPKVLCEFPKHTVVEEV